MSIQIFWGILSYILFSAGLFFLINMLIIARLDSGPGVYNALVVICFYVGSFVSNYFARK